MLEFIPKKQVPQRLSEGWRIFSYNRHDYAALMYAPAGCEPLRMDDKKYFKPCSVEGCLRKHRARGYCKLHYERVVIHGAPLSVAPTKYSGCTEPGCMRRHRAGGLCNMHRKRAEKLECRSAT